MSGSPKLATKLAAASKSIGASHVLVVPYVCLKEEGPKPYGYGKKRARCPKCGDLQDNETFHAQAVYPHPSSSFAMYYEPHWSWCCAKCYAKKEVPMMAREEYDRLFNEQLTEFYLTP